MPLHSLHPASIRIQDLTLEGPAQPVALAFDPKKEIGAEEWAGMQGELERLRTNEDTIVIITQMVTYMKVLGASVDLLDAERHSAVHCSEKVKEVSAYLSWATFLRHLGVMLPPPSGRVQTQMMQALSVVLRDDKDNVGLLTAAAALKLSGGEPDLRPEQWEAVMRYCSASGEHVERIKLFRMRQAMLLGRKPLLPPQFWVTMKEQLHTDKARKDWTGYARLAYELRFLSADAIDCSETQLRLVDPALPSVPVVPPLPAVRVFRSDVKHTLG